MLSPPVSCFYTGIPALCLWQRQRSDWTCEVACVVPMPACIPLELTATTLNGRSRRLLSLLGRSRPAGVRRDPALTILNGRTYCRSRRGKTGAQRLGGAASADEAPGQRGRRSGPGERWPKTRGSGAWRRGSGITLVSSWILRSSQGVKASCHAPARTLRTPRRSASPGDPCRPEANPA